MDDALVGRGPELVVLGDFLARSAADGGALLLTGEPGVGKTALLQAAATRAAQADTRLLQTAGSAVEMISFSGLTQVVMPLLAYDDCLSADQREAVSVALGLADGRPPQPAALSQAVLALLRAIFAARVTQLPPVSADRPRRGQVGPFEAAEGSDLGLFVSHAVLDKSRDAE